MLLSIVHMTSRILNAFFYLYYIFISSLQHSELNGIQIMKHCRFLPKVRHLACGRARTETHICMAAQCMSSLHTLKGSNIRLWLRGRSCNLLQQFRAWISEVTYPHSSPASVLALLCETWQLFTYHSLSQFPVL